MRVVFENPSVRCGEYIFDDWVQARLLTVVSLSSSLSLERWPSSAITVRAASQSGPVN